MIERIVVPLDGSLTAEAILPQVRRVLYRNDSELILVRAVVPPPVENSLMIAGAQLGAAREYILGKVEGLERAGVKVNFAVRIGSPIGVILDVVEEEKATMVAMATHGSTGVARFLMGSVAEGVMRKCPAPVLVVRPFSSYDLVPLGGPEHRPIRNLLLPVDGSDLSIRSIPSVVEFADLFESRVMLLRVLETKKGTPASGDERAAAEMQLKELAKILEKKGVETLQRVEQGDPVEEILKAVQFHEIDLVAMTTHGRSGVSRAVMGSVTETILRQVTVPMLVIRSLQEEREKQGLQHAKSRK